MGAGKTTVGREVARLTERRFVDLDEEIERRHRPIPQLFADGEPGFRRIEEELAAKLLNADDPCVIALGGGALGSEATRKKLRNRAVTVALHVDVEEAWARVRTSDRPLAQDEATFRRLYEERLAVYGDFADRPGVPDVDGVLLASLGVEVGQGARPSTSGPVELIADERVIELHQPPVDAPVHTVPPGEEAKRLDVARRLWDELDLGRDGTIVAFGGGCATDLAGFVAATYLRGVPWVAVPTTLVGQVDAAIGGKTGIDLAKGKNLVGAFHFPAAVIIDPDRLATLPEQERRNGMAEVVKMGLLAGRPLWDFPEDEMVRACAAYKCAIVLSDPYEGGRREILNLGHTFGHALEAASDYTVPHGEAVALGLLAALRLSGQPTDVVEKVLSPQPVRVDAERAWAALGRDKKVRAGKPRLVLLRAPGEPEHGVELPDREVRAALNELIASS
jgi:shikimate kinase / 3-dehydroquinate synthase